MLDTGFLCREMDKQVRYPVLLAGVTGAHQFGLATEDSDIDIRGIYVKPTEDILSLRPGRDTIENLGTVDIQFYEAAKAFHMLLSHNGNMVQFLLSPTVFYVTWGGEQLRKIATRYVTKQLATYYVGYATSQRKRAAQNRGGKALIYTYYEIFGGIHVMREGKIEYNYYRLRDYMANGIFQSALLPVVFARPKWQVVDAHEMGTFNAEWETLKTILHHEAETSALPDTYDGYNELNALLLDLRYSGSDLRSHAAGECHSAKDEPC